MIEQDHQISDSEQASGTNEEAILNPEMVAKNEALKKVKSFLDRLFQSQIPERLIKRLESLDQEGKIIISDEQTEQRLREVKTSPLAREMTKGFFDCEKDSIYLRENTGLNEQIHEILHYISFDNNKGNNSFGLKETDPLYARRGVFLNEAFTILLAKAAEMEVDLNDPGILTKLASIYPKARQGLALSYQTALNNLVDQFRKQAPIGRNFTTLAKDYFASDVNAFYDHIEAAVGKKGTREFQEQIEQTPARQINRVIIALTEIAHQDLLKSRKLSLPLRQAVINFCNHVEGNKSMPGIFWDLVNARQPQVQLDYEYPEYSRGIFAVKVDPALHMGKVRTIPQMTFNLGFGDLFMGNKEFQDNYFKNKQNMAFIIWQAAKLEAAKRGELLEDKDFYKHPYIREFMGLLNASDDGDIYKMARKLLGASISDADFAEINLRRQKRSVGSGVAEGLYKQLSK